MSQDSFTKLVFIHTVANQMAAMTFLKLSVKELYLFFLKPRPFVCILNFVKEKKRSKRVMGTKSTKAAIAAT